MARKKESEKGKALKLLFQDYLKQREEGTPVTVLTLIQDIINAYMQTERELYLQQHPEDYANGFYNRTLSLTMGQLDVKVPRVRTGKSFRPSLLPEKWKRVDKDYENLLLALLSNGYSRAKIKKTLEKLKLPYSEESIEELVNLIYDKLDAYKTSPLSEEMFAVFIDAYHSKLRDDNGKIVNISLYVAVGINMEGYKQIVGWWVKKGKENKGFWAEVLQDLIFRGLSKVFIFVTDDFNGLKELIARFFPLSDHQLCLVHLKRNLKRTLEKEEFKEANRLLRRIYESDTREEALNYWEKLLEVVRSINPQLAERYRQRTDNYLAFVLYPEDIRKFIYTTNPVESVNAGLEMMRLELGGYFPSLKTLEVNLFVQLSNLNDRWMRKPIPAIRGNLYRIRQLMNAKFTTEEVV